MDTKNIPDKYKTMIDNLKYGSSTIQSDVLDHIVKSKTWNEAQEGIKFAMINLISECSEVIEKIADDKNFTLKHALRIITSDRVDEVVENCGQIWFKTYKQWRFVMIEDCEGANED